MSEARLGVRWAVLGGVGMLAACACGREGGAAARPAAAVCAVTLHEALPEGKPLTIHLRWRGPEVSEAFGAARTFNQAPHVVDASGLRRAGGRLTGRAEVTIQPDNWTPKDRKPVACAYVLDAAVAAGGVRGTFTGTYGSQSVRGQVTGSVGPVCPLAAPARFELLLERPLDRQNKHWQNRAYVGFTMKGGTAVAPKIASPNNTTYADWTCRVDGTDVRCANGRLTGTIEATINASTRWGGTTKHTFAIDAAVIGGAVGGRFTTRRGGKEVAGGPFLGSVARAPASDPAHSVYELHLHSAAPDGRAMWVHLDCTGGAFGEGLAFTPRFNHAVHNVDASGLKLADGRVRGSLKVTVNADPYVPKDGRPIACAYTIDAAVADGGLKGAFEGTFGPQAVCGVAAGLYRPKPELSGAVRVSLKMEQGVTGSNPWHNRTYIGVTLRDGKPAAGSFSNNKGAWKGTFDAVELEIAGGALTGTITGTVTSGRVKTGTYVFALEGKIIGEHLIGSFTSKLGGSIARSGRFMGTVKRAD